MASAQPAQAASKEAVVGPRPGTTVLRKVQEDHVLDVVLHSNWASAMVSELSHISLLVLLVARFIALTTAARSHVLSCPFF